MPKRKKDDSIKTLTEAPAVPAQNWGKIFPVSGQATAADVPDYELLDVEATSAEYTRLEKELQTRASEISKARATINDAVPTLTRMQALLSQRGSNRKAILKAAGAPKWNSFAKKCAASWGYTVRQLRNLIREFRAIPSGPKKKAVAAASTKEMLQTLLDVLELVGNRIPVPIMVLCRDIQAVRAGKIDRAEWRERVMKLNTGLEMLSGVRNQTESVFQNQYPAFDLELAEPNGDALFPCTEACVP